MKCAYKQAVNNQILDKTGKMFLSFMDLSAGVILHEQLGFGRKRLERFYNESFEDMMSCIKKYGTVSDNDRDQVADGFLGTKASLKYYGIEIDEWEKQLREGRKYQIYQRPGNKNQMLARVDFVDHAWMIDVSYCASAVKWLHDAYNFGPSRALPIYNAMRQQYEHFVDLFLKCSPEADRAMDIIMDSYYKQMKDIGIEFNHKWW